MTFIGFPGYVYAICDPRCGSPFYIGQSTDPVRRWKDHRNGISGSPVLNSMRCQSILHAGQEPQLLLLFQDQAYSRQLRRAEAFFIVRAIREGLTLVNSERDIRLAHQIVARIFPEKTQ